MKKLVSTLLIIATLFSCVAIVSYAEPEYAITVTQQCSTTGVINRNYSSAVTTAKVTLIINVMDGYELESVSAKSAGNIVVPLTEVGDNVYTFSMPSSEVFVSIIYKKLVSSTPIREDQKLTEEEIEKIFGDATKIDTGDSGHEVYVVVKPGKERIAKAGSRLKGFFNQGWVKAFFVIFDIILFILLFIWLIGLRSGKRYFEETVQEPNGYINETPVYRDVPKIIPRKKEPVIEKPNVAPKIPEKPKQQIPVCQSTTCKVKKCNWCIGLAVLYVITAINIGYNIGRDKKDGHN